MAAALLRKSLLLLLALLAIPTVALAAAPQGGIITVNGPIGPATARYVSNSLEQARIDGMRVVILRLDTPGGLSAAMHHIVKSLLASPVPVVGFVAPSGARAASAGTYILYACAIAAMAPATHVGAATPVSLLGKGGDSAQRHKLINDAVAFLRSLAERHGRNAQWAAQAVRKGASLSAKQALKKQVINLMAPNTQSLLQALDGREALAAGKLIKLHTASLTLVHLHPGLRTRVLGAITHPTVAYILMLFGILGIVLELVIPGTFVPGTVGIICLLLAAYAFQILPVNFAGLGLIVVGVGLMIAEAFVPTFGALGIGGIVAFVAGSLLLMDTHVPGYQISLAVIAGVAIAAALALAGLVTVLWRSHRTPPATGDRGMIGTTATALQDMEHEGWVRAHGEQWRARAAKPVHRGQLLRIVGIEGLTLLVEPTKNEEGET